MESAIHVAPCPFCGHYDVEIDEVAPSEFAVDCPECRAMGPITGTVMEAIELWNVRQECSTLAAEVSRLRTHSTELAKWADKAAMVLATIEAEDTTEEEQLQNIIDGISTWAPDALMGTNMEVKVPA